MKVVERCSDRHGSRGRVLRALVPVLSLLAAAGVLFGMSLSHVNAELATAQRVAAATDYLRPVGKMLAELVAAQAGTAAGGVADTRALERAVSEVDRADETLRVDLGEPAAWADLRQQIVAIVRTSGPGAARAFGETAALTQEFGIALADRSGFVRADRAAAGTLVDAVALRIPALLVASGAYVQSLDKPPPIPPGGDTPVSPVTSGQEVAARARLAQLVEDLDRVVIRGAEAPPTDAGESLVSRAAEFRSAAGALVPPAAFADAIGPPADPDRISARQEIFVRAGLGLQDALLTDLAARTEDRRAELLADRLTVGAAGAAVLVLAVWMLWASAGRRPRERDDPGPAGPLSAADERGASGVVMVDARSLLGDQVDAEELVRVGRAVRRPRRYDDEPT
jgi:hypothetical protein